MIHRAIYGTLGAVRRILIEPLRGRSPSGLLPSRSGVAHLGRAGACARALHERLRAAGIRSHLDERNETLNYRIRDGELQKIPYMAVVGQREADAGLGGRCGDGERGTSRQCWHR